MATHSSILAWGIPWTEEPGGLLYTKVSQFSFQIKTIIDNSLPKTTLTLPKTNIGLGK